MKRRLEKLIAKRRQRTGETYQVAKLMVLAEERRRKTKLRHTRHSSTTKEELAHG